MRTQALDTASKLTPRQRLTRGLTQTATGPVDVTRGVVGLGVHSAVTGAAQLRQRYRESRLAREVAAAPDIIARELASAQDTLSEIPQALQQIRRSGRRRGWHPGLVAGVAAAVLTVGAAAFVIIRRSSRPNDPSPRPPSVDVQPRP